MESPTTNQPWLVVESSMWLHHSQFSHSGPLPWGVCATTCLQRTSNDMKSIPWQGVSLRCVMWHDIFSSLRCPMSWHVMLNASNMSLLLLSQCLDVMSRLWRHVATLTFSTKIIHWNISGTFLWVMTFSILSYQICHGHIIIVDSQLQHKTV